MKVNPSISNYYLDYRYADEILHPFVIISYVSSGGNMVVTFDSYIKDINMVGGISWDDIRFTASSTAGDADLTIWIDSLNSSYTIQDFEAGKIINGIGLYGSGMHHYIQDSPNITVNSSAPGHLSGTYAWHEPEEEGEEPEEYLFNPYPMTAHYYLETFSVDGITTIDMKNDTLTFTGSVGIWQRQGFRKALEIRKVRKETAAAILKEAEGARLRYWHVNPDNSQSWEDDVRAGLEGCGLLGLINAVSRHIGTGRAAAQKGDE